jgi:PAS domain S-box-containing protein
MGPAQDPTAWPAPEARATTGAGGGRVASSLRLRVLALIVVALLPALAGSAWYLVREAKAARQAAFGDAALLARSAAQALRWTLDDAQATLEAASWRRDVRALAATPCDPLFADASALEPRNPSLTLWRLDGTVVCGGGADAARDAPAADAPWFRALRAQPAGGVSDAVQLGSRWVVVLGHPVLDDRGQTVGLLTTSLDLAALNERLSRELPPGALLGVFDTDYRILARSDRFAERVGKPVPTRFQTAFTTEPRGFLEDTGIDGVRRLYAMVRLPGVDWQVWAAFPEDEVLAPYRAARTRAVALMGAVLLVVLGLALWQLRAMLRPVDALADAARAVTAGIERARAPVSGPTEIRNVAIAFNHMLDTRDVAQQALRESEARFRALTDLSTDWYWEQDAQLRFVQISDGLKGHIGRTATDDIGRTRWELDGLVDPEPALWAAHRATLERREPFRDFEMRRRGADGQVHTLLISGLPVFDADGRFAGYRGVGRDVTRQRDAERAVAARERRYRTLVEQLPVGVVEHAADSSITLFNEQACRLLGMTPEQMQGRQALDPQWHFVDEHGHPLPSADYPVVRVLATGEPVEAMVGGIVPQAGSEPTWVYVNAYPETDAAGAVLRVVVVFIDITAQRQAAALREARDMAELANRAKSAFMSRMSHELRTPLNAVLGFSQLLEVDPVVRTSPVACEQVQMIHAAGNHLLDLVNDLLDLARIEAGEMRLHLVPVDLVGAVDECVGMVRPMAAAKGVSIHVQAPGVLQVTGERARLRQVLANLLSNAVKYNRPQGEVDVQLRGVGDRVAVAVRDTGSGLTPVQQAGLFQPFNRLDAEVRGIEGTGLGLVIAKQLVELMGGSLEVTSTVGVGSTFTVWLPRADPLASPPPLLPPAPPASAAAGGPPPEAPRGLACVYVEDNAVNAELVRQVLAQRPRIELHVAADGERGIELVRRHRPALVLLDLDLPGIDGHEVLRRLRAEGLLAGAACVAVTAAATAEAMARTRASGFDDVVIKPFDLQRLLAVVDARLREAAPPRGGVPAR